MAITRIFDMSQRSLATYQKALDVTAHNVANASNPDYARQKVDLTTVAPDMVGDFSLGAGVKIDQISRVKDEYLERTIIENNSKYYANDKKATLMQRMEGYFMELTGAGISDSLNEFFNSWSELSTSPTSLPLRNNIITSAQHLTTVVSDFNDNIDSMRSEVFDEFSQGVDELNQNLKNLYEINLKIAESRSTKVGVNDLLDQRDKIVQEMSKLGNLTVNYNDNGVASVTLGGIPASNSYGATEFKIGIVDNKLSLVTATDGNKAVLKGGELSALSEVYSTSLLNAKNEFNGMIQSMAEAVNAEHVNGRTITDPPRTNIEFFTTYENGDLNINSDILDDPSLIAASITNTDGNGDNAIRIAELIDKKLYKNKSISDSYSSLVSSVGNEAKLAENLAEANQLVLGQLEARRSEVSAVSVDEEMTNILKYQRSYDASAKLIKVADELLQTILNLV